MKRFENELLRQLSLISYDRGRILSEQNPDPLGRDKDNILIRTASKTTDKDVKVYNRKKAREVYNKIVREIDGSWFPRFDGYKWDWGTDEEGLTDAVLSIENKNQLDFIKTLLFIKYPEYRVTDGSLLKFIQNMEFSKAMKDEVRKEWLNTEDWPIETKLNPITTAQLIQYYFNDKHLLKMKYHLQRFDKNETLDEVADSKGIELLFPPIVSQSLHVILPLASLAISLVFPPTWLALGAAALLELGDAALYLGVEKDEYAAGLAAICAFIPFGQLAFMPLVYKLGKNGLQRLLQKVIRKEGSFIDEEIKAMKEIAENLGKLEKMTKLNMAKKFLILSLRGMKSFNQLRKFLVKLLDRGLLKPESIGQIGFWVGGSFLMWDKIAAYYGICNTMPLSALKQTDWKILKSIGYIGGYLQPFSSPCELNKAYEVINDAKNSSRRIITTYLENELKKGNIFDLSDKNYSLPVLFIQRLLESGGFNKNLTSENPTWSYMFNKITVTNAKEVKKITIYTKKGVFVKKFDNTLQKDSLNFDVSKLQNADYNIVFENVDGSKYESKFTYGGQSINTPIKIKRATDMEDGYYDEITYLSVKKYQKSKGLSDDGQVGPNTLKSMISDYENKRYGLTDEKLEDLNPEVIKKKKEQIEKDMNDWYTDTFKKTTLINKEDMDKAIIEDKEQNKRLSEGIIYALDLSTVESASPDTLKIFLEPINQ